MKITRIIMPPDFIPDGRITAEKAALRVTDLVINHLRKKNASTAPSPYGMPKTNYYAEAADTAQYEVNGNAFSVSVGTDSTSPHAQSRGLALHYDGGTVRPKKKALAIPIDPLVAGIWPSEYDPYREKTFVSPAGAIGDKETGRILYLLLPSVTIPADKTVLPTDEEIFNAATLGVGQLMGVEA